MELNYQNPDQPTAKDMNGRNVFPYDVVIIKRLADFMINANDGFYERFLGCPAILVYQDINENSESLYWYDISGEVALIILCQSQDKSCYYNFDLSFPLNCLEKLDQNAELLSLFIPFCGPIDGSFVEGKSFFNFKYIEGILEKNGILK
jgi:hypothetical protein